jgi:hypothetical protein
MANTVDMVAIDIMPDGTVQPAAYEEVVQMKGPPEGLSRQVRRRWQRLYDEMIAKGSRPGQAWFWTTQRVLGKHFVH